MATAPKKGFTLISDEETAAPAPTPSAAQADPLAQWNTQILLLALKAVSQRALTAITNLFTLGLVVSAWWLWDRVLLDPTVLQLVGLGGYALFCLAIDIVRRRS